MWLWPAKYNKLEPYEYSKLRTTFTPAPPIDISSGWRVPLRQLRSLRNALTSDASKTVVHAFVSSRVDYCNSVSSLIRAKHLRHLQSVLNAAARIVARRSKYDHISVVIRDQVHWLSIVQSIEYKLCSLVFKYLHQSGPKYLSQMCKFVSHMS